ncbi:MAG: hypothetical protein IPM34_09145 [Saprospiraceae bacterium]|nr:hypothetical protein [Saprospiraceae bacterium]
MSFSGGKLNSSFHAFQFKSWQDNIQLDFSYATDFIEAFNHSKTSLQTGETESDLPPWNSIGPFDIAGRSLCLAMNPVDTQIIWMGSAGSGLWRSNSGGLGDRAWSYVATGFPVQSVSAIALDPLEPETLYIATGENYSMELPGKGFHNRTFRGSRGIGILKSTDEGKSWKLILNYLTKPDLCVWKIVIPEGQSKIVFAAGNMGILKSEDAGENWYSVFDTSMVSDLLVQSDNPGILYAGVGGIQGNIYGLYKSRDGGQNWNYIESPAGNHLDGRIMLASCKSHPQHIYAAFASAFESKGILRTTDGFETTKYYVPIKDVSSHQGWYAKSLQIKDDDPSHLLIGGVDLYYDSTGTGNKLLNLIYRKIKIHADFHDVISNPRDPNKIYFATDGGMYRSDDFCKTVLQCNGGYLSTQVYNGSINKTGTKILAGLQDNKTALYEDGVWKNIHLGDGTFNSFHPVDDQILLVSSQFQNLYQSENSGIDWKELLPPNSKSAFVAPFTRSPLLYDLIYSGGDQFYTSENGGLSWIKKNLTTSTEKIICIHASKHQAGTVLFASYDESSKVSRIYISPNKGTTIRESSISSTGVLIRKISGHPVLPNVFYAATSSFGSDPVLISKDSGMNWESAGNHHLPRVPCHSVLADPLKPETLYAGTDLGLYVSFDSGLHWEAYNAHPYDVVPVYDLIYDGNKNKILVFTHGFGVFTCERLEKSIPTKIVIPITDNYEVFFRNKLAAHINLPKTGDFEIINLNGSKVPFRRIGNKIYIETEVSGIYLANHSTFRKITKKFILL